jgi:hypothetical protein
MDIYGLDEPSVKDVVSYIDQQLVRDDEDWRIAYSIAGLHSLPNIDDLREDSDLDDIVGLAGSLEIPNGSQSSRGRDWDDLRAAVNRLRARIK